ncbi:FUSC family protein [Microbacterium protaetiae]|nr:FUSC family protein [Microbacterium protaetiae]
MLVLLATGRLDLLGAAAFGAFAAVFGRDLAPVARLRVQAITGAGLTAAVTVGLAAAHLPLRPWSSTLVVVLVAVAATVLGNVVRWKPAGPLFFVFASGAFASGPALGGWASALVVAVTAGTASFAVLVGMAGAVVRGRGRLRGGPRQAPWHGTWRDAAGGGVLVDVVVASSLAGAVAIGLGLHHVYWAVLSAVVPASVSLRGPWLVRGTLRVVGTAAGLVVAAALLMLQLPGWALVPVALGLQLGTEMFVQRNYGVAMLFITPLALLIGNAARPGPMGELLSDRFWGTAVGIGIGLAVLGVRALSVRADQTVLS